MKKYAIAIIFIYTLTAMASEVVYYTIKKKRVKFINFPQQRLTLSYNCGQTIERMRCQAYKRGITASRKNIDVVKFQGGIDPGVVICQEQFKGEVVLGTDKYGENAFCKFADHSMIDTGSLTYYANKSL